MFNKEIDLLIEVKVRNKMDMIIGRVCRNMHTANGIDVILHSLQRSSRFDVHMPILCILYDDNGINPWSYNTTTTS